MYEKNNLYIVLILYQHKHCIILPELKVCEAGKKYTKQG